MRYVAVIDYRDNWSVEDTTMDYWERYAQAVVCYDEIQARRVALALNRLEQQQ
jgi:hypothetical protein